MKLTNKQINLIIQINGLYDFSKTINFYNRYRISISLFGVLLLISSSTLLSQQNVDAQIAHTELHVGEPAPDFTLIDPEKGKISKENFLGEPLFIFFTTTWCTPCQIGAQNLAKFDDEKGGDTFNVLIVFVDDKETDNQFIEWKQKFGRGDWYIAKGIEMAKNYNVKVLDTKYVFDKDGIIKWIDINPLEYKNISPILSPLL